MLKLSDEQAETFARAVRAARSAELLRAVHEVYARFQIELNRRKPRCDQSGRCCHFEAYGHRLFVTTAEVAAFVMRLDEGRKTDEPRVHDEPRPSGSGTRVRGESPGPGQPLPHGRGSLALPVVGSTAPTLGAHPSTSSGQAPGPLPAGEGGCPYQLDNLCSVHAIRPFGCRVFFCDPTSTDWQQEMYERFHGELKSLHEQFGVDYMYVEWREALRAIDEVMPEPAMI